MGFEQLAKLKKQLAAEAPQKPSRSPKQSGSPKKPGPQVDPVLLAIGRLQKLFPRTFPKNPAPKRPLKIGIYADLVARKDEIALDEARLKEALSKWCRTRRYWASIIEGAPRVNLDGEPDGLVTASEAGQARGLESRVRTQKPGPQ